MAKRKNVTRCPWVVLDNPLYVKYHDEEWGVPVHSDRKLFEFLVLESAQAGLSWLTILRKRSAYKKAFAGFDPQKVARFTSRDVARLMKNSGIVRNELKIRAAIQNAKRFLEVQKEFGSFATYLWGFVHTIPIRHTLKTLRQYPTASAESIVLSHDLKKRGFSFLGPVICYAYMQATGMINDHSVHCFRRTEV